jgi:aminoglycoside phosphotransferase (APT) family kinase protein
VDEREAAARATAVVGPLTTVSSVQGFVGNQTFRLQAASGETYYLKSGLTIEAEAIACKLARSVGVPAPEVLAVGDTYLICAEVPGSPSSAGAVITEAGRALRRLHGIHGNDGSWAERLLEPIERLDVLGGIVPDDLRRRLRVAVPPFIDTVADVEPVLLHGDLHPRHLYAVGNELTGVIDWGDAMYGDPLFDLARFSMAGGVATEALLDGYGLSLAGLEETLSMYRVLWALMALRAEAEAGGDWFAAHLDTIGRELS